MKKYLLLASVAALAFTSCSDQSTEFVGSPQAREIAFAPIAKPTTRAAVDGAVFTPTTMMVTAYDATKSEGYFGATAFNGTGAASAKYSGGKYWPFTPATINFLAIANANADNATGVTWGPTIATVESNPTEKVQIVMANNSTNQYDLMYACGRGSVTQDADNTLHFPTDVPMGFKHAQAWVKFYVQAANAVSEAITINYIKLNSVSCQGTYLVTHTNWNSSSLANSVAGVWSDYGGYAGNIDAVKDDGFTALDYDAETLPQYYGSLMVVPNQGMASFIINYTVGGKTYDYTYTPASTSLAQATKYTYNITLTLHEILIAPTVEDWTEGGPTNVSM